MKVTRFGIMKAAAEWTTRRRKIYEAGKTYICPARDVFAIGSVWNINPGWRDRVQAGGKYEQLVDDLKAGRWGDDKVLLVGIATNGFVSLLDGNHRLSVILFFDLFKMYPEFPVQFRFISVGDVINPYRPEKHWDGANLNFVCYPRGTCGMCGPCRRTLPEITEILERNGLA